MKKVAENKKNPTLLKDKSIDQLLKKALGEPGVAQVFLVFEKWQALNNTSQPFENIMHPKFVASFSDRSTLVVHKS
ncbi:MAG: hypothetical protein NTY09_12080 [bacterium]|nr:hypothetical protein [bacterium]